ncbi:MAG: DNA polymerase, partial [Rickettsiales bacterium]
YCELNLPDVGVYRYVNHPSFEILMIAYSLDDDLLGRSDVEIIDMTTIDIDSPALEEVDCQLKEFENLLKDPEIIKPAFNANFERTCLAKYFGPMPPQEWDCTMVRAMRLGLPGSLDKVAKVLKLPDQKMKEGKALITFFSKPCKPTKKNGGRTRNLPEHDPERWALFLEYCKQDVRTEIAIRDQLIRFEITEQEVALWNLDQEINDRGVLLDLDLVHNAIVMDDNHKDQLMEEARQITGVANPKSNAQLKQWLTDNTDLDVMTMGLNKTTTPKIVEATKHIPEVAKVLQIRAELNKTSTSKYSKMAEAVCDDNRVRGLLQFYGASRTGRWAGRLVQDQNLPQNKIPDLEDARNWVLAGDAEIIDMLYGNVPAILSQLIRTAFVPKEGHKFYVADFSAIEARVIAWISGEDWRMKVFNTHGKIYEASASEMFDVPIETIAKGEENYPLRAKGKIAELALGYGGAAGALKAMGALDMGLEEDELKPLVNKWRKANPMITQFWWDVGDAAMEAVVYPGTEIETHGLKFLTERGILFLQLYSGRKLACFNPRIEKGKYDKDQLVFDGMDQTTKQWTKIDTYGPKLVENIVQAVSRDLLAHAMIELERLGFRTVMHVHDEVIVEGPEVLTVGKRTYDKDQILENVCQVMGIGPEWSKGLPLNADGYYCDFYMKD